MPGDPEMIRKAEDFCVPLIESGRSVQEAASDFILGLTDADLRTLHYEVSTFDHITEQCFFGFVGDPENREAAAGGLINYLNYGLYDLITI